MKKNCFFSTIPLVLASILFSGCYGHYFTRPLCEGNSILIPEFEGVYSGNVRTKSLLTGNEESDGIDIIVKRSSDPEYPYAIESYDWFGDRNMNKVRICKMGERFVLESRNEKVFENSLRNFKNKNLYQVFVLEVDQSGFNAQMGVIPEWNFNRSAMKSNTRKVSNLSSGAYDIFIGWDDWAWDNSSFSKDDAFQKIDFRPTAFGSVSISVKRTQNELKFLNSSSLKREVKAGKPKSQLQWNLQIPEDMDLGAEK